jgi:hypothetical protein
MICQVSELGIIITSWLDTRFHCILGRQSVCGFLVMSKDSRPTKRMAVVTTRLVVPAAFRFAHAYINGSATSAEGHVTPGHRAFVSELTESLDEVNSVVAPNQASQVISREVDQADRSTNDRNNEEENHNESDLDLVGDEDSGNHYDNTNSTSGDLHDDCLHVWLVLRFYDRAETLPHVPRKS